MDETVDELFRYAQHFNYIVICLAAVFRAKHNHCLTIRILYDIHELIVEVGLLGSENLVSTPPLQIY